MHVGIATDHGGFELKEDLVAQLNLMQDADGKKRKAAAQALSETFKKNLRPFTMITNTLAKDKEISDRWRGFKDVADARHLSNRVEHEVVDALVAAVRAAYPRLSHRYYALKAKWFGKKALPHWDRNAPLPKVDMRTIGWPATRCGPSSRHRRCCSTVHTMRRSPPVPVPPSMLCCSGTSTVRRRPAVSSSG